MNTLSSTMLIELTPDGLTKDGKWQLVPKEPTEVMKVLGCEYADPLGRLISWDPSKGDCTTRDEVAGVYKAMLSASPTPPAAPVTYQDRVAAAHHALFHDDPTDVPERVARFMEEANETCQAFGMTREEAHQLVDYTYSRPAGEPAKEIGAAMLTLTSLCVVAGYDLMPCAEADLEKLKRPETIARIRSKRSTRHGRGPLPGFSTTAQTEPAPYCKFPLCPGNIGAACDKRCDPASALSLPENAEDRKDNE